MGGAVRASKDHNKDALQERLEQVRLKMEAKGAGVFEVDKDTAKALLMAEQKVGESMNGTETVM